ncbi:spore photoproduct lyase family protein [Actinoplanes derwentensis]|uniref:Spore photoproduct lyase family protein n=1 Tax=Actinoplanes derwentensis TaxID=113562 RepID=A0A1H1R421_9ACTN|nr:spore photoproduct lyase family protein [Actinoplanes derwentensis]GID88010.1 spore photoproduct lyase family protein [Actinoplanes derwentensis]SDS30508.1 spore photoproduct lyase family protein [Actinoplanes derwentensis]
MLDIKRIYLQAGAADLPRGREILDRWPAATIVDIESHQRIPEVYGAETNVRRWVRIKREALVVGIKKTMTARPNGRSADFIAPSTANGCAMACAYCYVPRHKGYSNPITVFANIERILSYTGKHAVRQGRKPEPNECDPKDWVYDIGENSDCSADALVSDNVRDLVDLFKGLPNAKASFATKYVNRDLLGWDPQKKTRIRFSLMPQADAKLLDIRTSPVGERIAAIDDFVAAGYEVHVNFSPVVVRDGWLDDWRDLLDQLDAGINAETRRQLATEIIFLTHNRGLHEVNLGWHPRAEDLLWRPELQQIKRSQNGDLNVRYRTGSKGGYVRALTDLIRARTPYLRIRYAF